MERVPENTDLFTMKEWMMPCRTHLCTPEDGIGYYASRLKKVTYMDKKFNAFKLAPKWATHVAWFNK